MVRMSQNTPRRGALGRGFAALIPDDVMDAPAPAAPSSAPRVSGPQKVPLDTIRPNPEQPRAHFDEGALKELAESIKVHGVLMPLVVRPLAGGGYALIAGERRWRAAGLAGLSEVPVVLRDELAPVDQLELALVENLQREDLNPVEAARGYQRLNKEFALSQEDIARRVGKDRATVANALRMLRLPEGVLRLVQEGRLSAGHARALLPLEDEAAIREIVSQILARDLSVRATEALVKARGKGPARPSPRPQGPDPSLRYATDLLTRHLNTAVAIQPKARGAGGRIVIDYYTTEDLERLIRSIRGPE